MKKVVFLDMDGVLADFSLSAGIPRGVWVDDPPCMFEPGFFKNLPIIPGAREAISKLLEIESLDLYIASKPSTRNPASASEKYEWIQQHFPELKKKMFLTCDKGLLRGDYLIDDLEKWGEDFQGDFLHFNGAQPEQEWDRLVNYFSSRYQ